MARTRVFEDPGAALPTFSVVSERCLSFKLLLEFFYYIWLYLIIINVVPGCLLAQAVRDLSAMQETQETWV